MTFFKETREKQLILIWWTITLIQVFERIMYQVLSFSSDYLSMKR